MLHSTVVLLFSLCGGIAAGVQSVNCDYAWSHFSGMSYGTLTHSSHCVERQETKVGDELIKDTCRLLLFSHIPAAGAIYACLKKSDRYN